MEVYSVCHTMHMTNIRNVLCVCIYGYTVHRCTHHTMCIYGTEGTHHTLLIGGAFPSGLSQ